MCDILVRGHLVAALAHLLVRLYRPPTTADDGPKDSVRWTEPACLPGPCSLPCLLLTCQ